MMVPPKRAWLLKIDPRQGNSAGGNGDPPNGALEVHFNPASLQFTYANMLDERGGSGRQQHIRDSKAQLMFELIFDTTDTGADVSQVTARVAAMMAPQQSRGQRASRSKTPSLVRFGWGTFRFEGLIESYKETLDYFSSEGTPLRATVNLTISRQNDVFPVGGDGNSGGRSNPNANPNANPNPVAGGGGDQTTTGPVPNNGSLQSVATDSNRADAMRSIAAATDEENPRLPSDPTLTIDPDAEPDDPTDFSGGDDPGGLDPFAAAAQLLGAEASAGVGAGASFGVSGGISLRAGASVGVGAFAGVGASAGVGANVSAFAGVGASANVGASAGVPSRASRSAGVSATQGAFAGLGPPVGYPSLRGVSVVQASAAEAYSTTSAAVYDVDGRALLDNTTVSTQRETGNARRVLRFEEE